MRTSLLRLAFAAAWCLAVQTARAEPWTTPSGSTGAGLGVGRPPPIRLWADIGFYTDDGGWATNHVFGLAIPLGRKVEIEAVLPTAATFGDYDGLFRAGNVYLGASYINRGPIWRVKFGGGIGLPLAHADNAGEISLYGLALQTRASQDPWYWSVDTVPIVMPLHVEVPAESPVVLTVDASASVYAPVRDRDETEFVLTAAPGVGFHLGDVFSLGLRMPTAAFVTSDVDDKGDLFLEPFLRLSSDSGFLAARMDLKMDEARRFTDGDGLWGFHLGMGLSF